MTFFEKPIFFWTLGLPDATDGFECLDGTLEGSDLLYRLFLLISSMHFFFDSGDPRIASNVSLIFENFLMYLSGLMLIPLACWLPDRALTVCVCCFLFCWTSWYG